MKIDTRDVLHKNYSVKMEAKMEFRGICLETRNVEKLVAFYEIVLEMKADGNNVHSSFSRANLAIYNPELGENRIISELENKRNNFVLMFEVGNVDEEYERLKKCKIEMLSIPESKPWGTRAFSFLDPLGNRINFLSTV